MRIPPPKNAVTLPPKMGKRIIQELIITPLYPPQGGSGLALLPKKKKRAKR
jgi:hypothetical protein